MAVVFLAGLTTANQKNLIMYKNRKKEIKAISSHIKKLHKQVDKLQKSNEMQILVLRELLKKIQKKEIK